MVIAIKTAIDVWAVEAAGWSPTDDLWWWKLLQIRLKCSLFLATLHYYCKTNRVYFWIFSAAFVSFLRLVVFALNKNRAVKDAPIPFGYVYESDLEDCLDSFVEIKAFPTHVCFKGGEEVHRVEGVNFQGIQEMLLAHASSSSSMPETGGDS